VLLINPLSEEQAALRRQLSYGLLDRALYNLRQGLNQGQLFEIGVVTSKSKGYREDYHLSAVSWGEPQDLWSRKQDCPFVIRFKDQVMKVFEHLDVALKIEKIADRSELPDFLHMGQSAWLSLNGERAGFIGHIHPLWSDEHKVRVPLCVMELRLDLVFKVIGQTSEYQAFSRYPYVERDLALVVPRNLASQTLEVYFQKSLNNYLQGIELFDIYEGEKLPAGHKQLGYRFRLQKRDGTLSDTEVNEAMDQLLSNLKSDLGVRLREA
jgi:phenylalanyl-tRNA synthetase beta chain